MYRYSALMDRLEGKDANNILQSYTDVIPNPRIKAIWERFLDYELGHLQIACDYFKKFEKRDPAEVLPEKVPSPIEYVSNRDYVREVLRKEVDLRAKDPHFVSLEDEGAMFLEYRRYLKSEGSPSRIATAAYIWRPGGELAKKRAA